MSQAKPVRWKRADRGRSHVSVEQQILPGKLTLPGVGHLLAIRVWIVAPGIERSVDPAPRAKLPFGFGRNRLARPARVGAHVVPRNMDYGVVRSIANMAALPLGVTPVRAGNILPPRQCPLLQGG